LVRDIVGINHLEEEPDAHDGCADTEDAHAKYDHKTQLGTSGDVELREREKRDRHRKQGSGDIGVVQVSPQRSLAMERDREHQIERRANGDAVPASRLFENAIEKT
jgi:hypothetical protein